jgi:hypothetical protein
VRLASALALLALAIAAVAPVAALASISFGSDLRSEPAMGSEACFSSSPCTHVLTGVRPGNDLPVASPTDGVVVSFGIKSSATDTVTFRLARLVQGGARATGAGTGPTVTLPSPGKHSFSALGLDLRVHAGDYVGVDTSELSAIGNPCVPGATERLQFSPTLVDGGATKAPDFTQTCEILVNAKVRPSSRFTFEKVKRNKQRGTATLALDLPGPGSLTLSGKGIKRATEESGEAGRAKLRVKSKGKAKRRLARRGKAKVTAEVTFKPEGGKSATKSERIKLVRR